jgi:hypothetical protein
MEKIATCSASEENCNMFRKKIVVILSIQSNQTMCWSMQMPCTSAFQIALPETPRRDMSRPISFQRLRSHPPPPPSTEQRTQNPYTVYTVQNPRGRKSWENLASPSLPYLSLLPTSNTPRDPISCVAAEGRG